MFDTAIPITINLLTVVTSSLEKLIANSSTCDTHLARDSYIITNNLASPHQPQPPFNTPTLSEFVTNLTDLVMVLLSRNPYICLLLLRLFLKRSH
jgi:hypothetical protein